ncbi:hypothetical protein M427DRAFT_145669, partial [Gonapodya prolifera JEL478]
MAPFIYNAAYSVGLGNSMRYTLITVFNPLLAYAFSPILDTSASATGSPTYTYYSSGNLTCRACVPANTGGKLVYYQWDTAARTIGRLIQNVSFDLAVAAASTRAMTQSQGATVGRPGSTMGTISQALTVLLYNATTTTDPIGYFSTYFSIENICDWLDIIKGSATPNSLFYIINSDGQVLAVSGTSSNITSRRSLLLKQSGTSLVLKTIFDYPVETFPVLNVTARLIYDKAGGNLSSDFADTQWRVGDNLFQVTSKRIFTYKYIIVSGAPATDYLGDTIALEKSLAEIGAQAQAIIIGSAAGVILIMSLISVFFTSFFVAAPLAIILEAIRK